jgi:hypothetical protein
MEPGAVVFHYETEKEVVAPVGGSLELPSFLSTSLPPAESKREHASNRPATASGGPRLELKKVSDATLAEGRKGRYESPDLTCPCRDCSGDEHTLTAEQVVARLESHSADGMLLQSGSCSLTHRASRSECIRGLAPPEAQRAQRADAAQAAAAVAAVSREPLLRLRHPAVDCCPRVRPR